MTRSRLARHAYLEPLGPRGRLQGSGEIGELLDLRPEDGPPQHLLPAHGVRAARGGEDGAVACPGGVAADYLALTDEPRRKVRRATRLARRAAENERVPTVLDQRLGFGAIGGRDLRDRLKAKDTATAKL